MMEKQQIMNKGWRGGRQERKVGGKFFFVSNWQNVKNQDGTKFSTGTFVLFLGRQSVGLFYISQVLSLWSWLMKRATEGWNIPDIKEYLTCSEEELFQLKITLAKGQKNTQSKHPVFFLIIFPLNRHRKLTCMICSASVMFCCWWDSPELKVRFKI